MFVREERYSAGKQRDRQRDTRNPPAAPRPERKNRLEQAETGRDQEQNDRQPVVDSGGEFRQQIGQGSGQERDLPNLSGVRLEPSQDPLRDHQMHSKRGGDAENRENPIA